MKKSLMKLLARMARDGDAETAAEIIEEILEPETAADPVPAEVPAETMIAVPEERTVTIDEGTPAAVLERLDRLIEILTPVPAGDEAAETGEKPETDEDPGDVVEAAAEAALKLLQ